jgi:plastocyanin
MKRLFTQTLILTLTGLLSSAALAADVTIIQKDKKFDKGEIKIKKGDKINFKNDEKDITHNVFSLGPKNAFELKTQAPGSTSTVEFKEPGSTDVECAIHTGMKLKVTVE